MTRDEIILLCRTEGENEDGEPWQIMMQIADERMSDEQDDPSFVPWSKI